MRSMGKSFVITTLILTGILTFVHNNLNAQQLIDLTFESAIDIAMKNSYRIRQLELGIERTRYQLNARRAALKSNVYMNLQSPVLNSTSEFKWNSTLQRDELVYQNTRRWQMDLSIRQPVILFGYPTNGYLSLNNRMYQYLQRKSGDTTVNYYNRYFIEFVQPFFQPNYLKNDIEQAELDMESEELGYIDDIVRLIDDIAGDYYDLFELSYQNVIYSHHVANLKQVSEIATQISQQDYTRSTEAVQVQVELANTQEKLLGNQSDIRLDSAQMKQLLSLDSTDSLIVEPRVNITPIAVNLEQAIDYGYNLRPRMQTLEINRRRNELSLEETKGRGAFSVNLDITYGVEKQDEQYDQLWQEYNNSYSTSVNAYVPIWDWGQRKANIEASKISIQQTDLNIEESRNEISSEITNAVQNLEEYQKRALSMSDNLKVAMELTELSIKQFAENKISVQDILRIIERQNQTEFNFLDAYLGYRRSLLSLMVNTHYDYEKGMSLLDQFRARQESKINSIINLSQNFQNINN